jgi:hypothetical protein
MTRLAVLASLLLSVGVVSAAQDVTGKWSGSFNTIGPDGSTREAGIFLDLKQKGTELTGTAGPNAERQWPLKGKIEGAKLAFEVQSDDGPVKITLTLADGHLKGEAALEANGQKRAAKIDAERVKQGAQAP